MGLNAVWAMGLWSSSQKRLPREGHGPRLRVRAAVDVGCKAWWFVTIPSVPHWLSMGLNMCLLAPRHPSLISRFSGVSSTWGSYHLVSEPLFTSSMGSNAVWAAALWSSSRKGLLGEARALPQSKSHHGR